MTTRVTHLHTDTLTDMEQWARFSSHLIDRGWEYDEGLAIPQKKLGQVTTAHAVLTEPIEIPGFNEDGKQIRDVTAGIINKIDFLGLVAPFTEGYEFSTEQEITLRFTTDGVIGFPEVNHLEGSVPLKDVIWISLEESDSLKR